LGKRITGNKELKSYLATHPPDPLPLVREGGVWEERGEAPLLNLFPPLLIKERGIKGVRLINN